MVSDISGIRYQYQWYQISISMVSDIYGTIRYQYQWYQISISSGIDAITDINGIADINGKADINVMLR